MTKYIEIESHGYVWRADAHHVADDRAKYYSDIDSSTTYEEEYDFTMSDDYTLLDWYGNNMDFNPEHFTLVVTPPPMREPDFDDCELRIVTGE